MTKRNRFRLIIALAGFAAIAAAPARAESAMVTACIAQPSGLPHDKCVCLENELRKVLTPDEMRIQILVFKGQYRQWRRKVAAMGDAKADDFTARVKSVANGPACNQ